MPSVPRLGAGYCFQFITIFRDKQFFVREGKDERVHGLLKLACFMQVFGLLLLKKSPCMSLVLSES